MTLKSHIVKLLSETDGTPRNGWPRSGVIAAKTGASPSYTRRIMKWVGRAASEGRPPKWVFPTFDEGLRKVRGHTTLWT